MAPPPAAPLERARAGAWGAGEYVGQESFTGAGEIRELARRAGIAAGVSVLDLCCGEAGPGRLITAETGCRYLGLDQCARSLAVARQRAAGAGLPCQFALAHLPPLPDGPYQVVLLLETVLAFRDKKRLAGEVARVLEAGGRFAFTLEEGAPLTAAERALMPAPDTVWLTGLAELTDVLGAAGLTVTWQADHSEAHHAAAAALAESYQAAAPQIARQIGAPAAASLITAHRLWRDWLGSGRVRKFAIVARRQ